MSSVAPPEGSLAVRTDARSGPDDLTPAPSPGTHRDTVPRQTVSNGGVDTTSQPERGGPVVGEEGGVEVIVRRLAGVAPEIPIAAVREIVRVALARTAEARIQTYRLVLAERRARQQLRKGAGVSLDATVDLRDPNRGMS